MYSIINYIVLVKQNIYYYISLITNVYLTNLDHYYYYACAKLN